MIHIPITHACASALACSWKAEYDTLKPACLLIILLCMVCCAHLSWMLVLQTVQHALLLALMLLQL